MIPAAFTYHRPTSLEEAVRLLAGPSGAGYPGGEAKLLAGGHSLLPMMKLRLAAPARLVDLGRVPGLAAIREESRNGSHSVVIGAMATHAAIAASPLVAARVPLFAETAAQIGDPQVRNLGTIGGSLAHADPAADWPAAVLAAEATLDLVGPDGSRSVPAHGFFRGFMTTDLGPAEIITAIRVPVPPPGPASGGYSGASYQKFARRAGDFALVGVACTVTVAGAGGPGGRPVCRRARLAATGVGDVPVRLTAVEAALEDRPLDPETIATAAARAPEGLEPASDSHASGEFRAHLVQVLARRAVTEAVRRAAEAA